MANLKAQIRKKRKREDDKTNVVIRLTHRRKVRYIPTEFYVFENQFDNTSGTVINEEHQNARHINIKLNNIINQHERRLIGLGEKLDYIDIKGVLNVLKGSNNTGTEIITFLNEHINNLRKSNKESYALAFVKTSAMLLEFSKNPDLTFEEVNVAFLRRCEEYYLGKGNKINGFGFHARNIRTVFNIAIDEDYIDFRLYPFRKYKIKKETTAKRALSVMDVYKLLHTTKGTAAQLKHRDYWALSLFLIGINFKDMLFMEKPHQGRLYYKRSKTKKDYSIKIYPEAQALIDKYKGKDLLLNIIEGKEQGSRKTPFYKDVTDRTNQRLKDLCENIDLIKVSTYYARHSWATIASGLGIQKDVISHALGHGNNTVTDIYIDFDLSKVDEANKKVIEAVTTL